MLLVSELALACFKCVVPWRQGSINRRPSATQFWFCFGEKNRMPICQDSTVFQRSSFLKEDIA